MLKSIYLGFRKAKVQRVTVVKFGIRGVMGHKIRRVLPWRKNIHLTAVWLTGFENCSKIRFGAKHVRTPK